MANIESPEFAVRTGTASSLRTFLRALASQESASFLLGEARQAAVANKVLQRLKQLSELKTDYRFGHPFDAATACYLWVLTQTKPRFAVIAAEAVVCLPRTWWSDQLGQLVLADFMTRGNTPALTSSANPGTNLREVTVSTLDSTDLRFLAGTGIQLAYVTEQFQIRTTTSNSFALSMSAADQFGIGILAMSSPTTAGKTPTLFVEIQ